jgi:hypothetical protein
MDPVSVKFVQLIVAELLGGVLCLVGVYMFFRGISGKSNLLLQGPGLKAKLTNSAPGGIIVLVGCVLIALSLSSTVERIERSSDATETLKKWLLQSEKVTDKMSYGQVTDTIVGRDPNVRFVVRNLKLDKSTTLGELAAREYGSSQYWRLIAAINKDRGYFKLAQAKEDTRVSAGKLIEAWQVSMYNGKDVETRTRVAGANVRAAYDELLARKLSGEEFDYANLSDEFKKRELELAYSVADLRDSRNLRELSLRYYGDPKYWPLIVWANKSALSGEATEDAPLPTGQELHVVHFLGWPR